MQVYKKAPFAYVFLRSVYKILHLFTVYTKKTGHRLAGEAKEPERKVKQKRIYPLFFYNLYLFLCADGIAFPVSGKHSVAHCFRNVLHLDSLATAQVCDSPSHAQHLEIRPCYHS